MFKWNLKQKIKTAIFGGFQGKLESLEMKASSQEIQTLIQLNYHYFSKLNHKLPTFDWVGFKTYSQFEEDGILLYIFSMIGTTNKSVVEICAGNGQECMAANLIINHGWRGYLFDGSEVNVKSGQEFYAKHHQTFLMPPLFKQAWFTAENVNDILTKAGVAGETVWGTSRDAQISRFPNLDTLGIKEQVKLISMVLTDFRSVLQVITRVSPDEVYNLAGQTSVGLSFEQPKDIVKMMIEAKLAKL